MASQVLSGAANPTYTNNTGQNVRIVINYMQGSPFQAAFAGLFVRRDGVPNNVPPTGVIPSVITINWAGVSATASLGIGVMSIGRGISQTNESFLPTELFLAPGQTFSAVCRQYNIVVIPEAG